MMTIGFAVTWLNMMLMLDVFPILDVWQCRLKGIRDQSHRSWDRPATVWQPPLVTEKCVIQPVVIREECRENCWLLLRETTAKKPACDCTGHWHIVSHLQFTWNTPTCLQTLANCFPSNSESIVSTVKQTTHTFQKLLLISMLCLFDFYYC